MFSFQLQCDCGYRSNEGCWGRKPGSSRKILILPIYDPDSGVLSNHEFVVDDETLSPENDASWHQKQAQEIVEETYGKNARILIPKDYDTVFMTCPKCKRNSCKAISTGIY